MNLLTTELTPIAHLDSARVDQSALGLASGQRVGEPARISALQVCAERGLAEVTHTALALADTAASIPLKISAIAALGALGDSELMPWLEQLADDASQPQFQPAARSALRQLKNRLGIQAATLNATSGVQ